MRHSDLVTASWFRLVVVPFNGESSKC